MLLPICVPKTQVQAPSPPPPHQTFVFQPEKEEVDLDSSFFRDMLVLRGK